ncbi:SRPBCC domain-containing protein [Moorena sp. SIOASIH]|uniref:SRPBCC domain-containing protein n=1 Tax=Moorena sp. SIOASIH TaxID=2607817 RepID=UPI0025F18C3D|nr:SRPBCC domain-containing protein [Moorena sp. SIOASIH]
MNITQASKMPGIRQRMSLMPGWTTEIVICAPQKFVWEQVTDFEAYSDWNPFVLQAYAQFEAEGTICFKENLKQFGQHWIKAQFLSIDLPNSFVWQGHFGTPFLFSVRHSFMFESINEHQTRFTQVHKNSGLLIPYLAWRGVYCISYQGYLNYNQALKERCESRVADL